MMLTLLIAAALLQDPSVDDLVRSLSSDDIAVREKATRELQTLGLDKLPQMEKHLRDSNAEVASRVRSAMHHVLRSKLGSRKARFELRPAAPEATLKVWIAAGADAKKPPEGYEARRFRSGGGVEDEEWLLLGAAVLSETDVFLAAAGPDFDSTSRAWMIQIELGEKGARKWDDLAAVLFAQTPKGRVAIALDNRVLMAPIINSSKFSGKIVLQGAFDEAMARDIARAVKGDWLESSMRAEKEEGTSIEADKAAGFLRGRKGFDRVKVTPDATGLDVSGYLDLKEVDLVNLWQSLRERGYRLAPKK